MRIDKKIIGMCFVVFTINIFSLARGEENKTKIILNDGISLASEGKNQEALQKLQEYVSQNDKDVSGYLALGSVALEAEEYKIAQTSLEKAVVLDPKSIPSLYGLAMLYEKIEKNEKARQTWQTVQQLTEDPHVKEVAQRHLERLR